jgi:hypothetical protein
MITIYHVAFVFVCICMHYLPSSHNLFMSLGFSLSNNSRNSTKWNKQQQRSKSDNSFLEIQFHNCQLSRVCVCVCIMAISEETAVEISTKKSQFIHSLHFKNNNFHNECSITETLLHFSAILFPPHILFIFHFFLLAFFVSKTAATIA